MEQTFQASRTLCFGTFEVDLRAAELRKNGHKIKLQEQPFQILLMLLEHPGESVTREELQKRLWPADTFVDFEHGVNTAITKLRQALGDDADNPRFIETLPRRGYRFIAPVERRVEAPAATTAEQSARAVRPGRRLRHAWVALGVALLLAGGFYIAWTRLGLSSRHRAGEAALSVMRVEPFTTLPGVAMTPAFSPDGRQVAFAWTGEGGDNFDIYVKLVGAETILRLTSDPARETSPTWSPDGRYIAFLRWGEHEVSVCVIPALGGAERTLAKTLSPGGFKDVLIDWSADGKFLALAERASAQVAFHARIDLLSLDTLETHPLTFPPEHRGDWWPVFSPDGRWLAFLRSSTYRADDIYVVPVAGGEPMRLTSDNHAIRGLAWSADSQSLIFSSDRGGRMSLWRIAARRGVPERLPVGDNATNPTISRQAGRLVYENFTQDSNIWRFELAPAPGRSSPARRLIASTLRDAGPDIAPDGTKIVFESDRSGNNEIWSCMSDGSNCLQLTSFNGPWAGTPRRSSDGRWIAFDSRPGGNSDIYVISSEGGTPRRLTNDPADDVVPSWSRDGHWIYFASLRSGDWQIWKVPAIGGPAVQVTKYGGFCPLESPDGQFLYYAKGFDVRGLWKVPVQGGPEVQVLDALPPGYWGQWRVVEDGIYFVNAEAKPRPAIEFYRFSTRHSERVAILEKDPSIWMPAIAVSPDRRWLLYTQVDERSGSLMLVENFR